MTPSRFARPLVALIIIIVASSVGGYYLLTPTAQNTLSSSTASAGAPTTFSGGFQWGNYSCAGAHGTPCPVGYRKTGSTISNYTTLLSGSGSFTFVIDPKTNAGTGLGQGSVTAKTIGFCNGTSTVAYEFAVTGYLSANKNVTIIFGAPTPINSTVRLFCTNVNGQSYESSGVYQFSSVIPNLINMLAAPGTTMKGTSGATTYEIVLR